MGESVRKDLHRLVDRMGLLRDMRVPIQLTPAQKREVRQQPELKALIDETNALQNQIICLPGGLKGAKGTEIHNKYLGLRQKLKPDHQYESDQALIRVQTDFHRTVDTLEIERQLSGTVLQGVTEPAACEPLPEARVRVAQILFPGGPAHGSKACRYISDENRRARKPYSPLPLPDPPSAGEAV